MVAPTDFLLLLVHQVQQRFLGQLQATRASALQKHRGRQDSVDFVGAFEDSVDAGVAIEALHRVVLMVAVAAMDLDGFVGHEAQCLRAENLGERAFHGELFDRGEQRPLLHQILDVAHDAVGHRLIDEHARGHLRQFVLDQPELANRLPERLALAGVAKRMRKSFLAFPVGEHRELEAAQVENVEGDDVASADLAQYVLHRYMDVVQVDRRGGCALEAHFLLFRTCGHRRTRALPGMP